MLGLTTFGKKPVTDAEFSALYEQALKYQATGDFESYSKLVKDAYAQGAPQEALSMLGDLAESTFASVAADEPA